MSQRSNSIIGLVVRFVKLRWAALDASRRMVVVGILLVVGMLGLASARFLLGGVCSVSGGCPTGVAAEQSPCTR